MNLVNRRPVGVVLSAIVLGCAAFFALLLAGSTALSAFFMRTAPGFTASTPGVTPPPASFLITIMAFCVLFYLVVATWAIVTLVGLIRGSAWARISILIIGGCLVALGLFSALGTFAVQMVLKNAPQHPGANPAIMHAVILVMAVAWLGVAAVGVWWLVYFNLHTTRDFFAKAKLVAPSAIPPNTIDFSYAQPTSNWQDDIHSLQPSSDPLPSLRQTPLSMKILGWLMILGAFICLLYECVPIPLFLFGVVLSGWPAHIFLAVWAALSGYVGYGLLRLKRPAWLLAIALFCLGSINVFLMFSPSYRNRILDYTLNISQSMNARMGLPAPQALPLFDKQMMSFSLVFGAGFSLILFAFLFVLLWRAQWAYKPDAEEI